MAKFSQNRDRFTHSTCLHYHSTRKYIVSMFFQTKIYCRFQQNDWISCNWLHFIIFFVHEFFGFIFLTKSLNNNNHRVDGFEYIDFPLQFDQPSAQQQCQPNIVSCNDDSLRTKIEIIKVSLHSRMNSTKTKHWIPMRQNIEHRPNVRCTRIELIFSEYEIFTFLLEFFKRKNSLFYSCVKIPFRRD